MSKIPKLGRIGGYLFASIVVTSAIPLVLGCLIDNLVRHRHFLEPLCVFLVMVLLSLLGICFKYIFQRSINHAAREYTLELQNSLLENLQQMSPAALDHYKHGELGAKFFRDCNIVTCSINKLFPLLITGAVTSIVSLIIIFAKNITIAFCTVVFFPVCFCILNRYRKQLEHTNKTYRKCNDQLTNRILNFLMSFSELKSMAAVSRFTPEVNAIFKKNSDAGRVLDDTNMHLEFAIMGLLFVGESIVVGGAGYLAWTGIISIGDVVVYQILFLQVMTAFSAIFQGLPYIEMIGEAWNSIEELCEHSGVEVDSGKIILNSFKGGITLKNISFSYDQKIAVFNNLCLKIPPKSCVAIVGPNGSGKSTLLKLIAMQMDPEDGELFFDGVAHHTVNRDALRREMAIVSQEPILLSCTLRDNISLRNPLVDDTLIYNLLQQVGLDYLLTKIPQGLDADMGMDGHVLSGGERQRLSIARVLAQNPKVIIFDELSNHLDDDSQDQIIQIIASLKNTCTVLIVSHDRRLTSLSEITLTLTKSSGAPYECIYRLAASV